METEETKFRELIGRYNAGKCSAEEVAWLESWYLKLNDSERILLSDDDLNKDKPLMWAEITKQTTPAVRLNYWKIPAIAAAVLLVIGTWFFFSKSTSDEQDANFIATNDIAPGKEDATLTLADGRKILLSDALNGELAVEAGVKITKSADGQLNYELLNGDKTAVGLNTLSTTNGQSYRIRLPDGSFVHLNAASSLSYSSQLVSNGKRNVKLTGEGYFEVAKNREYPFVVETNQQQIEVVGTHFNINAYADDGAVRTTLEEGAVKVRSGNTVLNITPGEQAVSKNGNLSVTAADLEEVLAWKNGYFRFNEEKLSNVMAKLAKWYNIEVVYTSNTNDETFTGTLSRDKNISQALNILEKTNGVKFKIEGRRITVMP
ncbi:fec operon regulator FecR [compost metagenome]